MNALTSLQTQAGQKTQERFYGAVMDIFRDPLAVNPLVVPIPCCHTHLRQDMFQSGAGIQMVSLIDSITFRAECCGGNIPVKGQPITLYPASGAQPINLQLWDGGLLPDGLVYQFVAVDANYKA